MNGARRPVRKGVRFERRVLLLALGAGLPGGLVALVLLWTGDFTLRTQWTLTLMVTGVWIGLATSLRRRVVLPLQTLSNLLAAVREEDFSVRARGAGRDDALGEVMIEMNALTDTLRDQRLGALEAGALLRRIMAEIDVAVFAFDANGIVCLANRAGERLLALPVERLLGRTAASVGLGECLRDDAPATFEHTFPGGSGRWEARRISFRQGGLPLTLLVLTDLSRVLRQEEREAWQRLLRVLGHELNNSLAPIRSVAGSLEGLISTDARPPDWEDDMRRGLGVIAARAEALSRFMEAYARLARLPQPTLAPLELGALIRRVVGLETRLRVQLSPGPEVALRADGDQLEQLLINLLRNAVDASLETGGGVRLSWSRNGARVEVSVEDEGPGLSSTANLFVPFFTTKPGGSGIGLVLSRQIAEAHGGTLTLDNRPGARGCAARLRLPL